MDVRGSGPDEAESVWFMNSWLLIRRAAGCHADGVSIIEHHDPHGDSPPLHVHRREDEVFHVLDGRLRLRVGDRDLVADAGATVVAPKGLPHTLRVESPGGARYLTITTGGGFENLVRALGRPATASGLPPQSAPTPQSIEALIEAAARNDIAIVGAPLR
jgi:mannose-6-phosphate isomerase-like protein (cupin superfamily)